MSQKSSSAPLSWGAEDPKRGREVLAVLAKTYPQLYLTPGPEGAKLYGGIVRSGEDAPEHSLAGFRSNEDDTLEFERTPAGTVPVITLRERQDFERQLKSIGFLRVMPSQANYFLCEILPPKNANQLVLSMLKRYNILLRDCSHPGK